MLVEVLILGLAAWRLTALLSYEKGPFNIFLGVRSKLGFEHDEKGKPVSWPNNVWCQMIECPWCLGGWFTAVAYGLWLVEPTICIVLAAWTVLIAVERWNDG